MLQCRFQIILHQLCKCMNINWLTAHDKISCVNVCILIDQQPTIKRFSTTDHEFHVSAVSNWILILKRLHLFLFLTCFSSIFFSFNSNHHWTPLHGKILKKKMHVTGNYVKITLCIILLGENLGNYIRGKEN